MVLGPCSNCLHCGINHPLKRDYKQLEHFLHSSFLCHVYGLFKKSKALTLVLLPSDINVFVNENHTLLLACMFSIFVCIYIIIIIFLLSNALTVVFMPQKNLCGVFFYITWMTATLWDVSNCSLFFFKFTKHFPSSKKLYLYNCTSLPVRRMVSLV